MASHASGAGQANRCEPYLLGWATLTQLMQEGASWSGNERNVCYVNLGDGRFVDASFASGLDFIDDGRTVASVDWDGDGDLDLWLRNRTGPQLRFLRNNGSPGQHSVQLRLIGSTSNRDAIGARVELHAGGRVLWRAVDGGQGYLSQSSKVLHFGLGSESRIDRAVVHWPGAESETLTALTAGNNRQGQWAPLSPKSMGKATRSSRAIHRGGCRVLESAGIWQELSSKSLKNHVSLEVEDL